MMCCGFTVAMQPAPASPPAAPVAPTTTTEAERIAEAILVLRHVDFLTAPGVTSTADQPQEEEARKLQQTKEAITTLGPYMCWHIINEDLKEREVQVALKRAFAELRYGARYHTLVEEMGRLYNKDIVTGIAALRYADSPWHSGELYTGLRGFFGHIGITIADDEVGKIATGLLHARNPEIDWDNSNYHPTACLTLSIKLLLKNVFAHDVSVDELIQIESTIRLLWHDKIDTAQLSKTVKLLLNRRETSLHRKLATCGLCVAIVPAIGFLAYKKSDEIKACVKTHVLKWLDVDATASNAQPARQTPHLLQQIFDTHANKLFASLVICVLVLCAQQYIE